MRIGIGNFPTSYSISPTILGPALEERGFDSLWISEHTHIPTSRVTPWPGGEELPSFYWESYEPFTYLAQVAVVTEKLLLGTGVCLVPQHHPLALAKRVASLDSLSNGRFLFGVGAGWNAEEMAHHHVDFQNRWKVLVESVEAMKCIWTQDEASFSGKFVNFEKSWAGPAPVRQPHPPIIIGASSKWAVERVVDVGDGWLPITGTCDLDERIVQMKSLCEEKGRDFSSIEISLIAADPPTPEEFERITKYPIKRLILFLPTLNENESLCWLDEQAELVAHAGSR